MFLSCSWFGSWLVFVEQAAPPARSAARFAFGTRRSRHISHTLRIGRCQCSGALGLRRIGPDSVDLLLGLLGDIANHPDLAHPAEREQRAVLSKVEAGDVALLVVWFGRNAEQLGGGVVAGKGTMRVACWHDISA
jgi:hypothetical protein